MLYHTNDERENMASKNRITQNKESALYTLNSFFDSLEENNPSKLDKLSYWIREYVGYLKQEKDFDPSTLLRYKRGDILKVNFGFRVGSELGGLHYCIVLDRNNSIKSSTITVLPLSSLKDNVDIHNLPKDRIYLGDELNEQILLKTDKLIAEWEQVLKDADEAFFNDNMSNAEWNSIKNKVATIQHDALKLNNEFKKLKHGSIGLVGQITTISKMRIYDPKKSKHLLSGIRLSNEKLDFINKKIEELYLFKSNKK